MGLPEVGINFGFLNYLVPRVTTNFTRVEIGDFRRVTDAKGIVVPFDPKGQTAPVSGITNTINPTTFNQEVRIDNGTAYYGIY